VRVEQVGGAVQRHDRLARAGAALDHEHAGQLGADDLVLLALDGGDDVGQAAGAGLLQRRDEGAGAAHGRAVVVDDQLAAEHARRLAEQLVLDAEELAAPRGEVPAADEAHGRAAGGPVERLGDRGAPVDDQRLLRLVGHGDAADVERLTALGTRLVDAAEHQAGVADVEVVEARGDVALDHLAFPSGLLGSALANLDHGPEACRRGPRAHEAVVRMIDVRLLGGEVGMGGQSLLRRSGDRPHYPSAVVMGPISPPGGSTPPPPPRTR
jgi:hypothetical protein